MEMKTPFPKVSGVTPEIRTTKKRFRPYTGTKAFSFCGTTLFGENRPLLSHTIICAPLITDRVPVGSYCSPRRGSEPPSRAHWELPVLPYFHRRRLSGYTWKFLLFPLNGFLFSYPTPVPLVCQAPGNIFSPFLVICECCCGDQGQAQSKRGKQAKKSSFHRDSSMIKEFWLLQGDIPLPKFVFPSGRQSPFPPAGQSFG